MLAAGLVGGCAFAGGDGLELTGSVGASSGIPAGASSAADGITLDDTGWTAKPITPDPALLAEAERLCLDDMRLPGMRGKLVIQDQRGPDAAAFLWFDGSREAFCLVARDNGRTAAFDTWITAAGPGGTSFAVTDMGCGAATVMVGTVAPGTVRLVIETAAGRHVDASLADGRFVAWWPGRDEVVSTRPWTAKGRGALSRGGTSMCGRQRPPVVTPAP
jgi:hypothetical protein